VAQSIRKPSSLQGDASVSLGALIHEHLRQAIELAVHEELAVALGVARYERGAGRRGYRNGDKTRTLTGPTSPLALRLLRATLFGGRGAREWTSAVIPRYQRRVQEVNAAIVGTYLAGATPGGSAGRWPRCSRPPRCPRAPCRAW
jgi:transposase-like protein